MRVDSPAKLNLVLRVLRKRKDGYHELCTLFHRISLHDTLSLKKGTEGIRLFCSHPRVPKKNNLIVRAFHLLKANRPFPGGVTVRLTKRIPIGGGLGGGSGNAAAFLVAMNRLFHLGLSKKKLMKLGEKLGSDVPFFISGARHAMGEGRGEKIKPLPFKKRLWFVLLTHPRGLSTRRVYQGFRPSERPVSLTALRRDVRIGSVLLEKRKPERASEFLVNDLLPSAERLRPSLKKIRESLSELHLGICYMSGSGPTQFLIFSSRQKALQAIRRLRNFGKQILLCHSN